MVVGAMERTELAAAEGIVKYQAQQWPHCTFSRFGGGVLLRACGTEWVACGTMLTKVRLGVVWIETRDDRPCARNV